MSTPKREKTAVACCEWTFSNRNRAGKGRKRKQRGKKSKNSPPNQWIQGTHSNNRESWRTGDHCKQTNSSASRKKNTAAIGKKNEGIVICGERSEHRKQRSKRALSQVQEKRVPSLTDLREEMARPNPDVEKPWNAAQGRKSGKELKEGTAHPPQGNISWHKKNQAQEEK